MKYSLQAERPITEVPSRSTSRLPTPDEIERFKAALRRTFARGDINARVGDSKTSYGITVELVDFEAENKSQAEAFAHHLIRLAMAMVAAEFALAHFFGDADHSEDVALLGDPYLPVADRDLKGTS